MKLFNCNISIIIYLIICSNLAYGQNSDWERIDTLRDASVLMINSKGKIYASNLINIFCSSDDGIHWQQLDSLFHYHHPYGTNINDIMQFNDTIIFMSTGSHGLQMSSDDGISWISLDNIPYSHQGFSITKDKNGRIYFASSGGPYFSRDTAKSWYNPSHHDFAGSLQFNSNQSKYVLFSKIVDGRTGEQEIKLYDEEMDSCCRIHSLQKLYRPEIVLSNSREYFVKDFDRHLFYSTDSGISWHESNKRSSEDLVCIIETVSGILLAATQSHGIIFSLDKGENWSNISNQVNYQIASMALHSSGHLYIGTEVGIFKSKIIADDLSK